MIIAHLTHELGALEACSLTCRSWYIAAAPHLHNTLTLTGGGPDAHSDRRLEPLSKIHKLGLIPLVKTIRVGKWPGTSCWFIPQAFDRLSLRYFSALTNVHTLQLQYLEIYRFIPDIERYFGHFSQTLRSITLYDPCCTPRQLSHFLSLFPNLGDIGIQDAYEYVPCATFPVAELVPFSAPKLRGRLALYNTPWVEIWTDLIASCGGLRFRHMELRDSANCTPILFEACAETLETLRFNTSEGTFGE